MTAQDSTFRHKHSQGFAELNQFWDKLDDLEATVGEFAKTSREFTDEPVQRLLRKIEAFEPSVSVIGQVKAGKSTLLNALIGETDLLPSDVNPWTSVITNVHLNSRRVPEGTRALFRFFDANEWNRLVETGGRLGEMANRAGFDAEAGEIRRQVEDMRQTTEARLGDEFHKLLDGNHAFPDIRKSVIDRYICYGDPDEIRDGSTEGVYADLTKSADLFIDLDGYPKGLCLRDTPGVNDTFMMREQITLNAISESRVCVIVLSAHQAMSTMDLALLKIICAVDAREVLIFVNRIDELADPRGESGQIVKSIRRTLERMGLGEEIEILTGSGYWANMALSGRVDQMLPGSLGGLTKFFEIEAPDFSSSDVVRDKAMEASGVQALHRAIARRVVKGPGEAMLADVCSEIDNVIRMNELVEEISEGGSGRPGRSDIASSEIAGKVSEIGQRVRRQFESTVATLRADLVDKLERAQASFVNSAVSALASHIETFGEKQTWNHEPSVLRLIMKSAYDTACEKLRRAGAGALEDVFDSVEELIEFDLDLFQDKLGVIDFPTQPLHTAPTALARTVTLDLEGGWWRRYFRNGSRSSVENRYRKLIEAETAPLIDRLVSDHFNAAVEETWSVIDDYVTDQSKLVQALCQSLSAPAKDRSAA